MGPGGGQTGAPGHGLPRASRNVELALPHVFSHPSRQNPVLQPSAQYPFPASRQHQFTLMLKEMLEPGTTGNVKCQA